VTLNRQTVQIDGWRFVGCTMWSDVHPRIDAMLGDLVHIPGFDGDKLRARHQRDWAWLDATVLPADIVITHHAPHFDGLATSMQHSLRKMAVSSAYYRDMSNVIAERLPALWIHGHTHTTGKYLVDGIPVVTNGRGRGHAPLFQPGFVIDVPEPWLKPGLG